MEFSRKMSEKFAVKNYMGSVRSLLVALLDIVIASVAYFSSFAIGNFTEFIYDTRVGIVEFLSALKLWPLFLGIFFILCFIFKIYRVMWRYAGVKAYAKFALCCALSAIIFSLLDWGLIKLLNSPPSYVFLLTNTVSLSILVKMVYAVVFAYAKRILGKVENQKRAMIIGAGFTAKTIVEELNRDKSPYKPVCFLDDDVDKIGRDIESVPVVGKTAEVAKFAESHNIETILFAIPSIDADSRKGILQKCVATGCEVKILPFLAEMVKNANFLGQVQDIKIEDLLGRVPITFDDLRVSDYIKDKVCCVTGGGGSIGSELCRQVAKFSPKKLIILDIYENSSYDIQQELLREYAGTLDLAVEIASVTDFSKMEDFFKEFKPEIIFHAAAHKHVPLMETNPEEAVKNNVFGTYNTAFLAEKYKAQKFIMISTDKAVNPTNIMGATKRCCEMVIETISQTSRETEFVAVRFGNVLGSNGSVIPLFKKQIANGGPVTVTHKEVIRYFMLIPEAVSLILQAGALANGGEIFVLDMGLPVKIVDLAENLIRMLGKRPYKDIQIEFTGLRPGEKLYEELLMEGERKETSNEKIFIGKQMPLDYDDFEIKLKELRSVVASNDKEAIFEKMQEIVPTYTRTNN